MYVCLYVLYMAVCILSMWFHEIFCVVDVVVRFLTSFLFVLLLMLLQWHVQHFTVKPGWLCVEFKLYDAIELIVCVLIWLHCVELYCIVLYCIIELNCIELYWNALNCLYCIELYWIALNCVVLYYCIVLYCIVLWCVVFYCIAIYACICLDELLQCGMVITSLQRHQR
jgi:hypothetical protein